MNATTILIIATTINIVALASQEIIIRPAEMKDITEIDNLCYYTHHNSEFKQALTKALSKGTTLSNYLTEAFIDSHINVFAATEVHSNFQYIIQQQEEGSTKRLLIAYVKKPDTAAQFAGYCRFSQDNEKRISMSYFVINSEMRNCRIGTHLIQKAFETFSGTTSCIFRWLSEDTSMNNFFEKHCIEIDNIVVDYLSGRVIEKKSLQTEPTSGHIVLPIILREFIFNIKKFE